ncbi:MAG TPA: M67 family metallopeptidase [Vicinamibacterales bacterium]|nr:M67 family metallopeptidase [Vicinamibacterales bacterium]
MTRPPSIRVAREVARAIRDHARRDAPRECCGLLLGTPDHVTSCLAMSNVARGTGRFRVDPRAHLDLQRLVRRLSPALAIVGVYHSHPKGPAVPSATDVAEAHYSGWIHLIAGPVSSRIPLRAFRIDRGVVEPLTVQRD